MKNYKFFENKKCEYYPCHKGIDKINCLFCLCPLFQYNNCGGKYKILKNKKKDCSDCIMCHLENGYDYVMKFLKGSLTRIGKGPVC